MKHGLALCCGQSPVYGPPANAPGARQYSCEVCHKEAGGWSHNQSWIASLWNQKNTNCPLNVDITNSKEYILEPELDIGNGWRFCSLEFSSHLPWQEREVLIRNDFALFKSPRTQKELLTGENGWMCVIDGVRCIHDGVVLRNFMGDETIIELPVFKGTNPFSIYFAYSWCTDQTGHYTCNITSYNMKWTNFFKEKLKIFK